MIIAEYPEHPWKRWYFTQAPRRYWTDLAYKLHNPANPQANQAAKDIIKDYMKFIETKYKISDLPDWPEMVKRGPKALTQSENLRLRLLGGLPVVLQTIYPHHTWKFDKAKVKGTFFAILGEMH